jgi:diphthamide synthase (EF-2-diphthine--ammonia ligase)
MGIFLSLVEAPMSGTHSAATAADHPKQLSERFVGRHYDEALLAVLLAAIDLCGGRGEFHTSCYHSPEFRSDIAVNPGEVVEREGFWFCDLCCSPGADPSIGHPASGENL